MRDDIYVYFISLPDKIHEVVLPCEDGYTVYIDINLDEKGRIDAYNHALRHVTNNDFEKEDVQEIEFDAH